MYIVCNVHDAFGPFESYDEANKWACKKFAISPTARIYHVVNAEMLAHSWEKLKFINKINGVFLVLFKVSSNSFVLMKPGRHEFWSGSDRAFDHNCLPHHVLEALGKDWMIYEPSA